MSKSHFGKLLNAIVDSVGERGDNAVANTEEKSITRDVGRLRVFAFAAVFLATALVGQLNEESDVLLHALDEYAVIALSILVLLLMVVWRSKRNLSDLKMQLNVYEGLFLVMLIFKIFAVTQEIGDPTDFGNEPPVLIGLIIALIQRFV